MTQKETPCERCGKPTFHPPTCDTCDRWIGTPPVPPADTDEDCHSCGNTGCPDCKPDEDYSGDDPFRPTRGSGLPCLEEILAMQRLKN